MRNIKLEIEYDGTNYCGWQVQNRRASCVVRRAPKSIQGTIERTLSKILQEKIHLISSGRTDAGVHALEQVANFKTNSNIALDKLQKALNALLPKDISIAEVEEMPLDFHSRFDVKSKLYRYFVLKQSYPSALLKGRVYFYPYHLDIKLMQHQARCLLGKHDFKSFCANNSDTPDTVRTIRRIAIKRSTYQLFPITPVLSAGRYNQKKRADLIIIDIEADGFLYNMVRSIVGTLIEIGRGRFAKGALSKILESRNRKMAGPTIAACGLYLLKVKY